MYESALQNSNLQAFLKTIAFSEGTDQYPLDGYNTIFTGVQFDNGYKDHPRQIERSGSLESDAAGRYQFMSKTWDGIKDKLELSDFSPPNQDKACCELISEVNSLNDICEGRFDESVQKCCRIWASFPDQEKDGHSHYGGQPSKSLLELRNFYIKMGGQVAQFE